MAGAFPGSIAPAGIQLQTGTLVNLILTGILACGYKSLMKTAAHIFKALADETRLRILCLLLEGELCVCDLMEVLQLPQSTVSRHLAYLKNAGWLDDRRCGVWMYYSIIDNGNNLHDGLMQYLRENLPAFDVAATDRERLYGFRRHNRCI